MEMRAHLAPSPLPDTGGPGLPGPGWSPRPWPASRDFSGVFDPGVLTGAGRLDGSSGPRPGLRPCPEAAWPLPVTLGSLSGEDEGPRLKQGHHGRKFPGTHLEPTFFLQG